MPRVQVQLDQAGLSAFLAGPGVSAGMLSLGHDILDDSKANMAAMGAVDTGAMRDSGYVAQQGTKTRVGHSVDYSPIVHEGLGLGRNAVPRPFLTKAAMTPRSLR